jgi:uncharacterized protein YbbC (DUF1343 family)
MAHSKPTKQEISMQFRNYILCMLILLLASCARTSSDKITPNANQPIDNQEEVAIPKIHVKSGLDVLIEMNYAPLLHKNVAIVTNHTAMSASGEHLLDLISQHPDINLVVIYGPEHGLRGNASAGAKVSNGIDEKTGVKVLSLYGKNRRPDSLATLGVDLVIFDIQDIGARFYTYISTMGYVMEACAEQNIPLFILDRMNPISGKINGPILNNDYKSFVGMYPIPIQHGMTTGELALMIKGEAWIENVKSLKLRVIEVQGWNRDMIQSQTSSDWISPSPNMRNLNEALLYPGLCLIEGTNVSEGRGTDFPFERIGAPFINGKTIIAASETWGIEGIEIEAIEFTPISMPGRSEHPKWENVQCFGIHSRVTDIHTFDAIKYTVKLLTFFQNEYLDQFVIKEKSLNRLWGDDSLTKLLHKDITQEALFEGIEKDITHFKLLSSTYLLYPQLTDKHEFK